MHGQQVGPVAGALFGDLDAGAVFVVPADAHLDGQRGIVAQGLARSGHHGPAQRRVQQQAAARAAGGDLGRGAAHVDIQHIKADAFFAHEQNGLGQRFGLGPEQLDGVQPVGRGVLEQREGFAVAKAERLGAGHLADGPRRAVVGHQVAAGGVGQPGHGGEHRPGGNLQGLELHGVPLLCDLGFHSTTFAAFVVYYTCCKKGQRPRSRKPRALPCLF